MDRPESINDYLFAHYEERHANPHFSRNGPPAMNTPGEPDSFLSPWCSQEYENISLPHVPYGPSPFTTADFWGPPIINDERPSAFFRPRRSRTMPKPTQAPQPEVPIMPNYECLDGSRPFGSSPNQDHVHENRGGGGGGKWATFGGDTHGFRPADRDPGSFHTASMEDPETFMDNREAGYQNGSHQAQSGWEGDPQLQSEHNPFLESARSLRQCLKGLKRERMELQRERIMLQELNSGIEEILQYCRNEERMNRGQPGSSNGNRFHNKNRPHRGGYGEQQCNGNGAHAAGSGGVFGDTTAGSFHHPPNSEHANLALDRYNSAWLEVLETACPTTGTVTLPWPSHSLQASELSLTTPLTYQRIRIPQAIAEDIYQLRKWNAFNFFTQACGLRSSYRLENVEDSIDRTALRLEIQIRGASRMKLEALKSQLVREKLRWHPDRLRRMQIGNLSEEEEETTKAVWGAVIEASRACERCLEAIRSRER